VFPLVASVFGHFKQKQRKHMTTLARRVPYAPDPQAPDYHDAFNTARMKSNDEATCIKFAWWFVDNCAGRMTPAS
jgi:hypothetical protein